PAALPFVTLASRAHVPAMAFRSLAAPSGGSSGRTPSSPSMTIQGIIPSMEELRSLFPEDFDQHPFRPTAVELAVEDLLPRPAVEPALGDGHDDLASHDLPLQVGVGVVLARAVVEVDVGGGVEGCQPLEPALVVLVQAGLVVVDEDRGRDVHGI